MVIHAHIMTHVTILNPLINLIILLALMSYTEFAFAVKRTKA